MSFSQDNPFSHSTKTQALTAYLSKMAEQLGPDARFPTIQQLCTDLGVSLMTLNRSLSELEGREVIRRKPGVGIFVASGKTQKTLGLVYEGDLSRAGVSPFWNMLVAAASERAAVKKENIRFYVTSLEPGNEAAAPQNIVEDAKSGRLDGVLLVGDATTGLIEWLDAHRIPTVTFANHRNTYSVGLDAAKLIRLGVSSLAEAGCQRIGLWVPRGLGWREFENRKPDSLGLTPVLKCFQSELKRLKLPFDARRVWDYEDWTNERWQEVSSQEQGFRAATETFDVPSRSRDDSPDGLVICDDMMTRGALVALSKLGIQPLRDVKIATHANRASSVLHGYENDLTLLEFDPQQIIDAMFSKLESLINGDTIPRTMTTIAPEIAAEVTTSNPS